MSRQLPPRTTSAAKYIACGVGGLLLVSAVFEAFGGPLRPGSVALWSLRVPVSVLAIAAETAVAAMLIVPRRSFARGASLLLWCAATGLVRWTSRGESCDCLAVLGGHPWVVNAVWASVLAVGVLDLVEGAVDYSPAGLVALWLGSGALLMAGALVGKLSESPLDADFVVVGEKEGRTAGVLRVLNASTTELSDVEAVPSCDCLHVGPLATSIPAGGRVAANVTIDPHPAWVTPLVTLRGRIGTKPVERTISVSAADR